MFGYNLTPADERAVDRIIAEAVKNSPKGSKADPYWWLSLREPDELLTSEEIITGLDEIEPIQAGLGHEGSYEALVDFGHWSRW